MRYVILAAVAVFVAFGLGLIIFGLATPDGPVASVGVPDAPPRLAGTHYLVREGLTAARELAWDLIHGFTASLRGRMHRTVPAEPPPR